MKKTFLLLLAFIAFWCLQVNGQWSVTSAGTDFTIDFDNTVAGVNQGAFAGTGFATTPSDGQLNTNAWAAFAGAKTKNFGEETSDIVFGQGSSTGGVTAGGIHAFEVETDNVAFGIQPSGTVFKTGYIALKIQNNTGADVNSVDFSYDVWELNDQNRSTKFNGEYSLDGTTWMSIDEAIYSTEEHTLDSSATWTKTPIAISLSIDIPDGDFFYFRWNMSDNGGSGSRDEFAFDNVTVNMTEAAAPLSDENDILTFVLAEETGTAIIDNTAKTVTIEVALGTDLATLTPTITISDNATIIPNSGVEVDFTTSPVAYTVTSESSIAQVWNVTVTEAAAPLSDENDILTFVLAEETGTAIIDNTAKTVTIEVALGTDLATLTPTITISDNATIIPDSGVEVDFTTSPVAYTVTSESSIAQVWNVTVTEAAAPLSDENDILTFVLAEETGTAIIDNTAKTVTIEVALGTDLTALTPTITISDNATIIPNSGVEVDFTTSPVAYTVTSESGIDQIWNVTVTEAAAPLSDENDILTFVLAEETGTAVIDNTAKTVTIEVALGTDLTALTPTITISDNATIIPNSGVEVDFTTSPVAYTVTSESSIAQVWNVTVTEAAAPLSDENDILTFVLAEETGTAIIDNTAKTVTIEVALGTDLIALTPTITISDNATIIPNSGVEVDFTTSPVAYTVTSESSIAQVWNVTVTEAAAPLSDENDILTFVLAEETGTAIIDNTAKTVTIEVALGTDLATLTPTITISNNATIIPNSGVAVDFTTSPVVYTVTSESGIDQVWNVTVTASSSSLSNQKDILTFAIYGQIGSSVIGANTIDVEMGWQSNVAGLTPTLTVSALATVSPVSGQTQDFTNPLTYTVTAENGTTKEYVVTVAKEETPLGANCENPFIVQIPTDLPYDHATTTCGLGSIYNLPSTNYDNGDDAIYRLDVSGIGAVVQITMSPELSQTGLFLFDDCPNIGTLINSVTNTETTDRVITASLPAGTYYVMVDKWPVPRCFPYELAIEELCLPPTAIQTANISATSSDIHWTAGGFETTWNIKVNQGVAIDPLTVDGDIVADTMVSGTPEFTIPVALNSLTTYYVYIKSGCGSEWAEYMFATPSSCPIPTNLTSTVTGANSASISWNELGMSSWLIKVSTSSLTNPDGLTADIEDNTEVTGTVGEFNLTGLTANTTYYWTVKSACGSPWATQKSFTTDCGIASIPYLQNFETAVVPGFPECTSAENLGTGNMWKTSENPGYGFTTKVLHYNFNTSSPADTWFYTEPVQLVAGTSYRLTFKYGSNSTAYAEKLKVMYGTSAVSTAMANDIVDYNAISNNTPNVSETDFIPSESGTYYLGFNCYSGINQFHLYVDDIFLDMSPTCPKPTNLFANNVSATSANLNWTGNGPATNWNVKVTTSATFNPDTEIGNIFDGPATGNQLIVQGLSANSTYYWYVQADCGANDLSYWAEATLTTDCGLVSIPYSENFTGVPTAELPNCWTQSHSHWSVSASSSAGGTSPELELDWSPTTTADIKVFLPKIDATSNSDLEMTFLHKLDWYDESFGVKIEYSIDNGTTWNTAWELVNVTSDVGPAQVTVDLSPLVDGEIFQLAFVYSGNTFDVNYWNIDNIIISGESSSTTTIDQIDINSDVTDISVCKGVSETAAIAALAPQITITDSEAVEYVVDLTWTIDAYVGTTEGVYNATGTFELPAGVGQTTPATPLEVTATVTVTNDAAPDVTCPADFTVTQQGVVALTGGLPAGGTYSGQGVTNNSFDPASLANGVYAITYTYTDPVSGCSNSCIFKITVDVVISINENEIAKIGVYPNPNNGKFNISFDNINGKVVYQIYDTKGSVIAAKNIYTDGNTIEEVSLNLIPGVYFVKVVTTNQSYVEKLVIE